ncbi:MAG: elongation factor P-like protein YeiP, partial [Gammaproteobacteria bacterium]|nr:elongation factor P-like protein YeiP [Gammaproteobacteria bacterium]
MPKAGDLKRGDVIDINGTPHAVKTIEAKSPSSRGASTLYKIRFTNLCSGQKLDDSFKGDDFLKEADCIRTQVQFSYIDGDAYVFMNTDDYSQYELNRADIEEQVGYLYEGLEGITALIMDDKILGIQLPQSVTLTITETTPGVKGATASARTKPARLSSGIEV